MAKWETSQALQNSIIPNQQYSNSNWFGQSTPNAGDYTNKNQNIGDNLFGMNTGMNLGGLGLEQLGQGLGIAGDLFGMYNQYQGLKLAKEQMANQKKVSNYNMANKTNFNNSWSNQAPTQATQNNFS